MSDKCQSRTSDIVAVDRFGERAVRVRELDRAVNLNGRPIHLALPPEEKARLAQKFNS
jgi:hypothetical protein